MSDLNTPLGQEYFMSAYLLAPTAKTTSGSAVEVGLQRLSLSAVAKTSIVLKILDVRIELKNDAENGSEWTY